MAQPTNENKMGVMPENKLLLNMALPMIMSMLVQACYNIVDSFFVSKLSEDALNAVSLAFPVQNLMIAVAVGTGVGINALLSRSLGQKDQKRVNSTAMNGLMMEMVSGLVFTILGLTCARMFYTVQTDIPGIIRYGTDYLTIIAGCSMGIFVSVASERLVQATGRTVYAMVIQGTGSVINLILDPLLIFGLFGFPRLEVAGAAVATAFTSTATAVFGIYFKLQSFIFMPIFGLTNGVVPIVAYNYGARKPERIVKTIKLSMAYAIGIMTVGLALFQLFPDVFLSLFSAEGEDPAALLSIGVPALRTISYCFVAAGFGIVGSSVFQALGHGGLSLAVSVVRQLVFLLPSAFLLARTTDSLDAVWWAFPFAEIFSMILSALFLYRVYQKEIAPLKNPM